MFPDLLGKLPRVLSASRKPRDRISLLPPTRVPPASLYGHPSRYHHETPSITSRPVPESLHLHCVYPVSPLHSALRPASSSRHSCVPRHPAFSCVLLRHLAVVLRFSSSFVIPVITALFCLARRLAANVPPPCYHHRLSVLPTLHRSFRVPSRSSARSPTF